MVFTYVVTILGTTSLNNVNLFTFYIHLIDVLTHKNNLYGYLIIIVH